MIEYLNYNDNLCSIAGANDGFAGQNRFFGIINRLMSSSRIVSVWMERPYYLGGLFTEQFIESFQGTQNVQVDISGFTIIFQYVPQRESDSFVKLLFELWSQHQHAQWVFTSELNFLNDLAEAKLIGSVSWEQLIELVSCFVVFKGIEEDVIWIGKSSDLSFKSILQD